MEKLFGFKMQEDKNLDENLDKFNKLVTELENIREKIYNEDYHGHAGSTAIYTKSSLIFTY